MTIDRTVGSCYTGTMIEKTLTLTKDELDILIDGFYYKFQYFCGETDGEECKKYLTLRGKLLETLDKFEEDTYQTFDRQGRKIRVTIPEE